MEMLKQQYNSHASEAMVHLRGLERALGADDIRHRIKKSRGRAALRWRRVVGRPKPGSPARVSTWKRRPRRVEPERPRHPWMGLSIAPKVGEPAYPLGPRFAGPRQGLAGGCAPSNPPNGNGT